MRARVDQQRCALGKKFRCFFSFPVALFLRPLETGKNPPFQPRVTWPRGRGERAVSSRRRKGDQRAPKPRKTAMKGAPRRGKKKKGAESNRRRVFCFVVCFLLRRFVHRACLETSVPWRCAWTPSQQETQKRKREREEVEKELGLWFFCCFFISFVECFNRRKEKMEALGVDLRPLFFFFSRRVPLFSLSLFPSFLAFTLFFLTLHPKLDQKTKTQTQRNPNAPSPAQTSSPRRPSWRPAPPPPRPRRSRRRRRPRTPRPKSSRRKAWRPSA